VDGPLRGACDEWNRLEGVAGVAQRTSTSDRAIVVCRGCRRPLDVRRGGQWVARHPEASVRTYTLPKYAIFGVDVRGIVQRSKATRPIDVEKFHRNDLGEAFTPAEGRLSREAILACVRHDLAPLEGLTTVNLVTMGVDAKGRGTLHYVIREHLNEYSTRLVAAGTVESFTAVGELMDLFGVNMCGIAEMPEWQQAHAFCDRFPGRAYAVGYLTGKDARNAAKLDVPMQASDEERKAYARRVQVLDTVLTHYRRQWALIPPLETLPADFADHLQAIIRASEEDEFGAKKVFYRSIAPDDYVHAEAHCVMATELFYRQRGLEAVLLEQQQPTAHDDAIDYVGSRLSSDDADDYREGFGGLDEFGPDLG
jgi:hypothetical protein